MCFMLGFRHEKDERRMRSAEKLAAYVRHRACPSIDNRK